MYSSTPPRSIRLNQGAIRRDNSSYSSNPRKRFQRPAEILEYKFDLDYLHDLSNKNTEELIEELIVKRNELLEYFQDELNGDFYVAIVQLLSKVCASTFHKLKREILQTYLTVQFTKKIANYISTLPLQDKYEKAENDLFWTNAESFWLNLIQISEHALNEIPNFAHKILAGIVKAAQMVIYELEERYCLTTAEEIKYSINNIRKRIDLIIELNKKKYLTDEAEKKYQEPPNDFRQISVYPTPEELLSNNMSFLRENVIEGPYRDVNHYLDVQFRLLREDFVSPLRKGIQGYLSNLKDGTNERLDSVTIYKKVRFLSTEMVNEDHCYRIKFDFSQQPTAENSKSFMYGSLLCFTRNTSFIPMFFGKVAPCNSRELKLNNGELIVAFTSPIDVSYNCDYLMLESRAFFEPYFHVMSQLQRMSNNCFPLEKYIVNVDTEVESVHYSEQITLFSKGFERDLNDSQKEAFKAALSRQIAIIQGPPGTGKTHLAKLIVRALVMKSSIWNHSSPILVICFTNHALDQFLEGISSFTEKIIRVGGQSKSEKLEMFNLKNMRKPQYVKEARQDYCEILNEIYTLSRELDYINSFKGIIVLGKFYERVEVLQSNKILNWLGGFDLIKEEPNDRDDVHDLSNSIFIEELNNFRRKARCPTIDVDLNRYKIATLEQEKHNLLSELELKKKEQENAISEKEKLNLFSKFEIFSNKVSQRLEIIKTELLDRQKFDTLFYERFRAFRESDSSELIGNITEETACISLNDRWNFYLYHLNNYKNVIIHNVDNLSVQFRKLYRIYVGLKDIGDIKTLQKALVVGMTTTCAARMKPVLEGLKSPIVIVEEAAEVLEAHITSALTEHCKHLILIGDHQQLKPSTADYSIEKKFKLGTSLFERMVINKIECFTLNVQHRMKPEISALIAPTIYPDLQNHKSVYDREAVRGVSSSLFFIDHKICEESTKNGLSKRNMHEVYFLIGLARHFLLNGYEPENITILVMYLEQKNKMENEKYKYDNSPLKDVRVEVLDNYQGEQSNIILLSLVRSNPEGKIGFLAIENRVCVALSRARDGLYIIGNMTQLSHASKVWNKIHTTLKNGNNIGPALELQCGNHPEKRTFVKEFRDFLKVPEGGCDQICDFELTCGHKCTLFCHIIDQNHEEYQCEESCNRLLCKENDSHICKKLCFEECGNCTYLMEKKLKCGHIVPIECHEDPTVFPCPVQLSTTLRCGHVVEKLCYIDSSTFPCPFACPEEPCQETLKCGHNCSGSSNECFQGRMHKKCVMNVQNSESIMQEGIENWSSLVTKYADLKQSYENSSSSPSLETLWMNISENLNVKYSYMGNAETVNFRKTAISFKLRVLEHFAEVWKFINKNEFSDSTIKKESDIFFVMLQSEDYSCITEQEINDIRNEFNRLTKIVQSLRESEEKTSLVLEIEKLVSSFPKFAVSKNNLLEIEIPILTDK